MSYFMSHKIFRFTLSGNRILCIKYTTCIFQPSKDCFGLHICQLFVRIRSNKLAIIGKWFYCYSIVVKTLFSVFIENPAPYWYVIYVTFESDCKRCTSNSHDFSSKRHIFLPVGKFCMIRHEALLNKISTSDNFIMIGRSNNKIYCSFIIGMINTWQPIACSVGPVISKKSPVSILIIGYY